MSRSSALRLRCLARSQIGSPFPQRRQFLRFAHQCRAAVRGPIVGRVRAAIKQGEWVPTHEALQPALRSFDLFAPRLAVHAPVHEVLAVVAQQRIAALAEPGPGAPKHRVGVERRHTGRLDKHRPTVCELRERHLPHRLGAPTAYESCVMDDATVTRVEPVVRVAAARCRQMGTARIRVRGQYGLGEFAMRWGHGGACVEESDLCPWCVAGAARRCRGHGSRWQL